MHWPSFSQQLIARQDRKDPVFRAFLLSLGNLFSARLADLALFLTFPPPPNSRIFHPSTAEIRHPAILLRQGTEKPASAVSSSFEEVAAEVVRAAAAHAYQVRYEVCQGCCVVLMPVKP
jgi:hypothetical protein